MFREYERSMATVLNAYVQPLVGPLRRPARGRLAAARRRRAAAIMKSNGGVVGGRRRCARQAIHTALSGPAAGVIGARLVGEAAGFARPDLGRRRRHQRRRVPDPRRRGGRSPSRAASATWPLHVPMIDIHTIGAGGGSIARVTDDGTLTVGPESAGAVPGPVCYGAGGEEPTVTDAHLVLGRIPAHLLGGEIALDVDARAAGHRGARRAAARPLAGGGGAAASSTSSTTTWSAPSASSRSSAATTRATSRWCPSAAPARCTAAELAALLGMRTVVVPRHPGVLSTFGLLGTEVRERLRAHDLQKPPDYDLAAVAAVYAGARAAGGGVARRRGRGAGQPARRAAWPTCATATRASRSRCRGRSAISRWPPLLARFHERHRQLYTYALPDAPVEIVTLRVAAAGRVRRFTLPRLPAARGRTRGRARAGGASTSRAGAGWTAASSTARRSARGAVVDGPGHRRAARLDHGRAPGPAGDGGSLREPRASARRRAPRAMKRRMRRQAGGARGGRRADPVTREIIKGALRAAQARDGGGDRAHRHVAVHPREERLLRGHPRRARPRGVRHHGAALRQPHGDHLRASTRRRPCAPGDLYWYNDCHGSRGGVSHSPDMVFAAPVFHRGRARRRSRRRGATSGTSAGMRAGSISPDATEIFHEGIIVPAVRIYREGVLNDEVFRIFLRNSRFPDILRGDIRAVLAGCRLGERRVLELFDRFGADDRARGLGASSSGSAATRSARRCESRIPDGTYESEDAVDGDGMSGRSVPRAHAPDQGGRAHRHRHARERRPGAGPINFIMHESVPKLIARHLPALRPSHACCSTTAPRTRSTRCWCGPGSILQPHWPAAARQPRPHAGPRAVERAGAAGPGHRRRRARAELRLQHLLPARRSIAATNEFFLCSDGDRGGLRRAAVRRRARRDLLRRAEELPGGVHGDGLPAAPAAVRAPPRLRRARAASAAAAA